MVWMFFAFHPGDESRYDPRPVYYTFTLKINNITDLYKGGKNNSFNITTDYYLLKMKLLQNM